MKVEYGSLSGIKVILHDLTGDSNMFFKSTG